MKRFIIISTAALALALAEEKPKAAQVTDQERVAVLLVEARQAAVRLRMAELTAEFEARAREVAEVDAAVAKVRGQIEAKYGCKLNEYRQCPAAGVAK